MKKQFSYLVPVVISFLICLVFVPSLRAEVQELGQGYFCDDSSITRKGKAVGLNRAKNSLQKKINKLGSAKRSKAQKKALNELKKTLSKCTQGDLEVASTCGTTTWNLTAGQTINVGSVTVSNDADNVYVTYTLDFPGATFGTLHAWVGDSLDYLPSTPKGSPIPGQFCSANGGACHDASGLTTYTFTIPFSQLNIADASQVCGQNHFVVTHAEVSLDSDGNGELDSETAFGGDLPGEGPRWWFYGQYAVCCDLGEPQQLSCETAFAKGGWVWTTDRKSNPENLPSLNLTKNRWGWVINLSSAPSSTSYDIWAGAGLNDTSKAAKVGDLGVNWDGTTASVVFNITAPGYTMNEIHLYAGDDPPTTIAPGQYGIIASFDPAATTHTSTPALADVNGDGVWLIAHTAVCGTVE